jgi:NitT/TauT family transport system permease protein
MRGADTVSTPGPRSLAGAGPVDEADLCRRVARDVAAADRGGRLIVLTGRFLALGLLLGSWAWLSGRVLDARFFSDPVTVLRTLVRLTGTSTFLNHMQVTLTEVLAGYGIGAAGGLILAMTIGHVGVLQRVLHPFLVTFYSIPKIALAPLIIMWFGLGILPKIVLAAVFVFFIVFMNTLEGLRTVNRGLLNVARVMGASPWQLLTAISLPTVVPFVLTAMRIAVPEAMIGAVIGEFIAANAGLGYAVLSASNQFNTPAVLAGIIILLVVVLFFDAVVSAAERRLLRWRGSSA